MIPEHQKLEKMEYKKLMILPLLIDLVLRTERVLLLENVFSCYT